MSFIRCKSWRLYRRSPSSESGKATCPCLGTLRASGNMQRRGKGGVMHGRSRMTTDPRIPTMPGQSTSGFHRPGRHRYHQPRSAVKRAAGGVLIVVHGRSRMTTDPRTPTMPLRSTSGLHRPGRHCLYQARSAAGQGGGAGCYVLCLLTRVAGELQ